MGKGWAGLVVLQPLNEDSLPVISVKTNVSGLYDKLTAVDVAFTAQ